MAIKVVRPDAADPAARERFDREARVVAGLRHPGVVLVHDYGVQDGAPFLVMELLPGPSLARVVADEAPLEVARATTYARDAAAALAAAHAAGVVHRDVKPGNLVLDAAGHVRVVDFGLAHVERDTATRLTAIGHVVGSAAYLAPEQAAGGAVDARTDLYALGCVLVAMLTGRPPFEGDSAVAVALQHLHADPPDLRELRPGVPDSLAVLVAGLLAKDPAQRPASAAEVVARLAAVDAGADAGAGATAVLPTTVAPVAAGAAGSAADPTAAEATRVVPRVRPDATVSGTFPGPGDATDRRRVTVAAAAVLALIGLLVAAASLGLLPGSEDSSSGGAADPGASPVAAEPQAEPPAPAPEPAPEPPAPAPDPQAPAAPEPDDPAAALATLRAAVDRVGGEGPGRRAQRDLERRVDRIESALRDADADKAAERLGALEQDVQDLVDEGRVPAPTGQVLLDAAAQLRTGLAAADRGGDREDGDRGEDDD